MSAAKRALPPEPARRIQEIIDSSATVAVSPWLPQGKG
jgi:hypothetical protein